MTHDSSARLPDGSRLHRRSDDTFLRLHPVRARHVADSGYDEAPRPPDLSALGLPDDMAQALRFFQSATQADRDSAAWRRASATLRRYAQDSATLHARDERLRVNGQTTKKMMPDRAAEAFQLATQLHEQHPRWGKETILAEVGRVLEVSRTSLRSCGVRPLARPVR